MECYKKLNRNTRSSDVINPCYANQKINAHEKLLLLAATALQFNMFCQSVPNGDFESWTNTSYDNPTGWSTGNARDIQTCGNATISRVSGFSGFGLRIQSSINAGVTSEPYVINNPTNPCSDPDQWGGDVLYSQQPTAITGYYRYNLPGHW